MVLTHRHPDHWTDLAGLHTAVKYGSDREGLQVWGTPEGRQLAEELTGGLAPTLDWRDIGAGSLLVVDGLCFTFGPTEHYVDLLRGAGRRSGRRVARVLGRHRPGLDPRRAHLGVAVFAGRAEGERPIDLLLCEATHWRRDEGEGVLHLSARQAGVLAGPSGARRLVLTHLWPGDDPEDHRPRPPRRTGRCRDRRHQPEVRRRETATVNHQPPSTTR